MTGSSRVFNQGSRLNAWQSASGVCAQMLARENTQRTFSGAMDALPQVCPIAQDTL